MQVKVVIAAATIIPFTAKAPKRVKLSAFPLFSAKPLKISP
jgi:hypothetical protein